MLRGELSQGGSTITQQLARNVFPIGREKELKRKLREIFLSFRLESEFSKQEILTLYLNKIYLGEKAYGVAAAAEAYFGKSLDDLTIAEAATLGGLPQRPARVNPVANPEAMRHRRAYVLRRMYAKSHITEEEYNTALEAPMQSRSHGAGAGVDAPYVAEMVRTALFEQFGEALYTDGYRVTTTVDARLQRAADVALRSTLLEYDRRHGWRGPVARGVKASDEDGWREALVDVPRTGGLVPSIVTGVAARTVAVYTKDGEHRQIVWEQGLLWARKPGVRAGVGPSPKTAGEIVRRGLPAGETVLDCALRELYEEAGLPESLARQVQPAGHITTARMEAEGWHEETLLVFNLQIPLDVQPYNTDGEVSGFECLSLDEVMQRIAERDFSEDAACVVAQGLLHGHPP